MKNAWRKVLFTIATVLLVTIPGVLVAMLWYFPRYLIRKEPVQIQPVGEGITLMSCNVRCLTPMDLGKRSWFYRADLLLSDIAAQAPGIIGFQEATKWQYAYLADCLQGYGSVITYRDDARNAEGCPIFYNESMYTLKDKGSFWLSETPDVMSKDWGAAFCRVCSYVILTDKATGRDFVVFNTHLDHVSDEARINGIGVVLDKIAQFGNLPAVIMGDFNALEGSQTYLSATEHFLDAQYAAACSCKSHTFQNWGDPNSFNRIDYFMISKTGFTADRYDVVQPVHGGKYVSDHCPIVLHLTLE